ncbi:MAG: hypothetical protein AB8B64_08180 [Granulosicoccus sp.]
MIFTQKNRLAIAVAGALSLGTTIVHAVDFNATTTLQNTLAVTVVQDFDIGTVFATSTGIALDDGVGGFVIDPADGSTTPLPDSDGDITLTSISTPTPAQGSVATIGDFSLTLPDTQTITAADFPADAGTSLINITNGTGNAVELVHESGNTAVPSLYMMHFIVEGVSDGVVTPGTTNDGTFSIVPGFGVTDYVFNIGATITTEPFVEPTVGAGPAEYQEGLYTGIFEVTASY